MTGNSEPQLALLSPAGDATAAPTQAGLGEQVRVLTWNVQHAAAARTHQQARWLATAAPHDVLVLAEVAAGETGALLARLLGEFGYAVHLPEAGADNYRVLLACRSPKDQRNVAKRAFQEAVIAALPSMSARLNVTGPVVITGDLNVVEPDHDPRYAVFGPWEYDFYRAFGNAGFVDVFRITHPSGMDYSWFGRPSGNGRRNGYRFNHNFITTPYATTVRDCCYLHEGRENGLSDHSPMTLTTSSTAASSTPRHPPALGEVSTGIGLRADAACAASPSAGTGHRDAHPLHPH
ncbi:MAG: endonuclease/exonuclease/phosphatase family protein [Pseudonocardiaceae bacterium]